MKLTNFIQTTRLAGCLSLGLTIFSTIFASNAHGAQVIEYLLTVELVSPVLSPDCDPWADEERFPFTSIEHITTGAYHTFVGSRAIKLTGDEKPLDLNGNGAVEIVATVPLLNALHIIFDAGTPSQSAVQITMSSSPKSFAAGDINGDGHVDLVTANSDSIKVLYNDGTGGFPVAYPVSSPTGSGPISFTLGDYNFDGRLDLVGFFSNAFISSTRNIQGYFVEGWNNQAVFYLLPQKRVRNLHANPEVDGKLDVAMTNYVSAGFPVTESVVVFRNVTNSPGGIISFNTTPSDAHQLYTLSSDLVVTDINGDGYDDIAALRDNVSGVTPIINSGSGPLAQQATIPSGLNLTSTIERGDFDRNGRDDLVILSADQASVSILYSTSAGLSSPFVYQSASIATSLAVADVDSDRDGDIVLNNAVEGLDVLINCPVADDDNGGGSGDDGSIARRRTPALVPAFSLQSRHKSDGAK